MLARVCTHIRLRKRKIEHKEDLRPFAETHCKVVWLDVAMDHSS